MNLTDYELRQILSALEAWSFSGVSIDKKLYNKIKRELDSRSKR